MTAEWTDAFAGFFSLPSALELTAITAMAAATFSPRILG